MTYQFYSKIALYVCHYSNRNLVDSVQFYSKIDGRTKPAYSGSYKYVSGYVLVGE